MSGTTQMGYSLVPDLGVMPRSPADTVDHLGVGVWDGEVCREGTLWNPVIQHLHRSVVVYILEAVVRYEGLCAVVVVSAVLYRSLRLTELVV